MPSTDTLWQCPQRTLQQTLSDNGNALNELFSELFLTMPSLSGNAFTGLFLAMPSTNSLWQCLQRTLSGNAFSFWQCLHRTLFDNAINKLFMAMPSPDSFWQCLHRTLSGNALKGQFLAFRFYQYLHRIVNIEIQHRFNN